MNASESGRDARSAEQVIRILKREPMPAPPPAADQWLAIRLRLAAERRRRALLPLRLVGGSALAAVIITATAQLLTSSSASLLMAPPLLRSPAVTPGVWMLTLTTKGVLLLALTIGGLVLWQYGESWIEP